MKLISSEQMQALDRRAIESGIAGETLMEAAGKGLASAIFRLADDHRLTDVPVLFLAGCGNNGGDAFVAASVLHAADWPVECWLAGPENKLHGAAQTFFRQMKRDGVSVRIMPDEASWANAESEAEIVVDGLLGTGASGEPYGVIAEAIGFINRQSAWSLIVAIDMPSSMAVYADLTVTMGLPKLDLIQPENIDFVGSLEVVDIGIPDGMIDAIEGDPEMEWIHPGDLTPVFVRRPRDFHKGDCGHVLCVGGSKGCSGAITLAARAALRSGAGLVSVVVPENIHAAVASAIPEAMVHTHPPDRVWSAVMAGPGMGRSAVTREQVLQLLQKSTVPLVLDADAVAVLTDHIEAIRSAACPVILTPHPGEFAALFGLKIEEVQEDRFGMARMAADRLGAVVVLKGAGTVVAAPNHPLAINLTGNPGMATGGMGDVLAGLLAGLVGQGIPPYQAACAAVWLHGRAGDLAAAEKSQAGLIASDLIEKLPDAFRCVSCR